MIDIVIPCLERLDLLTECVKTIKDTQAFDNRIIILDNGSTEDFETFAKFIDATYIRNETNIGLFKSYNQGIKAGKADWIAFLHNDILIYEKRWDLRLKHAVKQVEYDYKVKVGVVGFAGSRGGGLDGGRTGFCSNLRGDICEIHGTRMTKHCPAVFLDGSSLICNRKMLEDVGGFDEKYKLHHIYDYDISMESLNAGYINMVLGVDFLHKGGETAIRIQEVWNTFERELKNDPELAKYGMEEMRKEPTKRWTPEIIAQKYNMRRFKEKWTIKKKMLPCYTTDNYKLKIAGK